MQRDYQNISHKDIQDIFQLLEKNGKLEQYYVEVKKSGNAVDEGQVCGMLNAHGGLVIIGIEELKPLGSGYTFHGITDLKDELGKVATQLNNLKKQNKKLDRLIDSLCICEQFTYQPDFAI